MPSYQMVLVLPKMDKTGLKTILKRSAQYIFEVGGLIKKMENLGAHEMPFAMIKKAKRHTSGHYFVFDYDSSEAKKSFLLDKFNRDSDVVRVTTHIQQRSPDAVLHKNEPECTLHLDFLPPPQRPSVIAMQKELSKIQKRELRRKFTLNNDLNYNPFR